MSADAGKILGRNRSAQPGRLPLRAAWRREPVSRQAQHCEATPVSFSTSAAEQSCSVESSVRSSTLISYFLSPPGALGARATPREIHRLLKEDPKLPAVRLLAERAARC